MSILLIYEELPESVKYYLLPRTVVTSRLLATLETAHNVIGNYDDRKKTPEQEQAWKDVYSMCVKDRAWADPSSPDDIVGTLVQYEAKDGILPGPHYVTDPITSVYRTGCYL